MPAYNDYTVELKTAIFNTTCIETIPHAAEFLELHLVEWARYRKAVGRMFRELLKSYRTITRVKLPGRVSKDIFVFYCRRVALETLETAIDNGRKAAVGKKTAITGIGWLNVHIDTAHEKRMAGLRPQFAHTEIDADDLPWMFRLFQDIRDGRKTRIEFDPWCGWKVLPPTAQEVRRVRKIKLSQAIQRQKATISQIKWKGDRHEHYRFLHKFRDRLQEMEAELKKYEETDDAG